MRFTDDYWEAFVEVTSLAQKAIESSRDILTDEQMLIVSGRLLDGIDAIIKEAEVTVKEEREDGGK